MIDQIVRAGAQEMLASASKAEVAAYIESHVQEVDEAGRRLMMGNGYAQPREVLTSSGAVGWSRRGWTTGGSMRSPVSGTVLLGDPAAVVPQARLDG